MLQKMFFKKIYCSCKLRKLSKTCTYLNLDLTMINVELIQDMCINYSMFKFQVLLIQVKTYDLI